MIGEGLNVGLQARATCFANATRFGPSELCQNALGLSGKIADPFFQLCELFSRSLCAGRFADLAEKGTRNQRCIVTDLAVAFCFIDFRY